VTQPARPDQHNYGIAVKTAAKEPVLAVTRGTIVSAERMADNTFAVVLQHNAFVATYRHVSKVLKPQGASVETGESIGIMDGDHDLVFELWNAGAFVNPEEVIVW
jgi:septal ring factor EnvC (AmiA/AmiB activator)